MGVHGKTDGRRQRGRVHRGVRVGAWVSGVLLGFLLLASGCGSDDGAEAVESESTVSSTEAGSDPGSAETTWTPSGPWPPYGVAVELAGRAPAPECAALAAPGPYGVGVRRIEVSGVEAEIWYPSDVRPSGEARWDFYDMREWLPEAEREKIPDAEAPLVMTPALRDAPVASEGTFPLLLFSHGFAAFRFQSTYWTTHMASHGFVVASVDHPARYLRSMLAFDFSQRNRTLRQLLDEVTSIASAPGDPLEGRIDLERVAVSGHSAGGNDAANALADPEVRAGVLFTPAGAPRGDTSDTLALVFAGSADRTTPPERVWNTYAGLQGLRWWLNIENAGHLAFSDLCLIGEDDGGLAGLAARYGVSRADLFADLASDGCTEDDLPAADSWALQRHAGAVFLRDVLEVPGAEPFDLDAIVACFGGLVAEAEGPTGPGELPEPSEQPGGSGGDSGSDPGESGEPTEEAGGSGELPVPTEEPGDSGAGSGAGEGTEAGDAAGEEGAGSGTGT